MKRTSQIFSLVLAITIAMNSCKISISDEQLDFLNIAQIGDTLIFCCDSINCDTLIISEKEIYYENLNPIFGNTFYKPQNASLNFYRPKDKKNLKSSLIQIWGKSTPKDSSKIVISLFYSHWFISESYTDLGKSIDKNIWVNGKEFGNNFIRTDISPELTHNDSTDLKSLTWNSKIGPVEYVDIHNRIWKRVK